MLSNRTKNKQKKQVKTCLPAFGGGAWSLRGGLRGEDWNVTAECQTLCPDGIIRDSTKAAPHKSASDSENRTLQERKQS